MKVLKKTEVMWKVNRAVFFQEKKEKLGTLIKAME
jgi:hypothetical protein